MFFMFFLMVNCMKEKSSDRILQKGNKDFQHFIEAMNVLSKE